MATHFLHVVAPIDEDVLRFEIVPFKLQKTTEAPEVLRCQWCEHCEPVVIEEATQYALDGSESRHWLTMQCRYCRNASVWFYKIVHQETPVPVIRG
jgi:hypothetical protein